MAAKDGKPLTVERVEEAFTQLQGGIPLQFTTSFRRALQCVLEALSDLEFKDGGGWTQDGTESRQTFYANPNNSEHFRLEFNARMVTDQENDRPYPHFDVAIVQIESDERKDIALCGVLYDGTRRSEGWAPCSEEDEIDNIPGDLPDLDTITQGRLDNSSIKRFVERMVDFLREHNDPGDE